MNTSDHQMQINLDKTKVILFNNAVKSDFLPHLTLTDDDDAPLEGNPPVGSYGEVRSLLESKYFLDVSESLQ